MKLDLQVFAFLGLALSATAQTSRPSVLDGNPASGEAFFKIDFPNVHGNGRSCATCHVPEEAFQLSPQNVEARYQALQEARLLDPAADDPLFRAIDANDFAEDFTNLRNHALVRVFIKLPTDANGEKLVWPVNDPNATHVAVWRSTPTVMNTVFTAPYQLDARVGTLQEQALGALVGHSEITSEPLARFLDDVAAFQKTQFSSPAVKLLADALARGGPLPPTDPPLTPEEQFGKVLFNRSCANCHGGPTQTVPLPTLLPPIHNIRISKPVPLVGANAPGAPTAPLPFAPSPLPARQWAFRVPGLAEPQIRVSTDPGQALLTGNILHLNFFDIPTLYGLSKTAPYFHDNSAATLEDVVRHYQVDAIFVRAVAAPGAPRPDLILDEEIAPLVAYLKKI